MAQKMLLNVARERMLEDRGALPQEDGNQCREYKGMHEENFLSSWLREDVKEGQAEMQGWRKKAAEDENKNGKSEVEREEENGNQEIRCVSSDVFEDFSPMDESDSVCCDSCFSVCVCVLAVSWCVLVVTDVSPRSMVSVLGEDFCSAAKSEFVEPQSFSLSLSGKRRALFLECQGGMSMEDMRLQREW